MAVEQQQQAGSGAHHSAVVGEGGGGGSKADTYLDRPHDRWLLATDTASLWLGPPHHLP